MTLTSPANDCWRWKTSALAYQTEQDTLDGLNIQLYSVKTGPEVTLNDIPLQAHLGFGYQHIKLDQESYPVTQKIEANLDYLARQDLILITTMCGTIGII